jgi:hypothetical protein
MNGVKIRARDAALRVEQRPVDVNGEEPDQSVI